MPKIKRVKRKEIKTKCHDFCEGETEEAYLRLIKRKYSAVNIKSKLKVKTCRRQGEALVEYAVSCIRSMGKAERIIMICFMLCMTRTNKPQNRLKTR